ncbi:MAG: hypothetical protein K0S07_1083 [Chlamydiales bacterium]|nr:hypothetical protein [Chlamydiales bacterium]
MDAFQPLYAHKMQTLADNGQRKQQMAPEEKAPFFFPAAHPIDALMASLVQQGICNPDGLLLETIPLLPLSEREVKSAESFLLKPIRLRAHTEKREEVLSPWLPCGLGSLLEELLRLIVATGRRPIRDVQIVGSTPHYLLGKSYYERFISALFSGHPPEMLALSLDKVSQKPHDIDVRIWIDEEEEGGYIHRFEELVAALTQKCRELFADSGQSPSFKDIPRVGQDNQFLVFQIPFDIQQADGKIDQTSLDLIIVKKMKKQSLFSSNSLFFKAEPQKALELVSDPLLLEKGIHPAQALFDRLLSFIHWQPEGLDILAFPLLLNKLAAGDTVWQPILLPLLKDFIKEARCSSKGLVREIAALCTSTSHTHLSCFAQKLSKALQLFIDLKREGGLTDEGQIELIRAAVVRHWPREQVPLADPLSQALFAALTDLELSLDLILSSLQVGAFLACHQGGSRAILRRHDGKAAAQVLIESRPEGKAYCLVPFDQLEESTQRIQRQSLHHPSLRALFQCLNHRQDFHRASDLAPLVHLGHAASFLPLDLWRLKEEALALLSQPDFKSQLGLKLWLAADELDQSGSFPISILNAIPAAIRFDRPKAHFLLEQVEGSCARRFRDAPFSLQVPQLLSAPDEELEMKWLLQLAKTEQNLLISHAVQAVKAAAYRGQGGKEIRSLAKALIFLSARKNPASAYSLIQFLDPSSSLEKRLERRLHLLEALDRPSLEPDLEQTLIQEIAALIEERRFFFDPEDAQEARLLNEIRSLLQSERSISLLSAFSSKRHPLKRMRFILKYLGPQEQLHYLLHAAVLKDKHQERKRKAFTAEKLLALDWHAAVQFALSHYQERSFLDAIAQNSFADNARVDQLLQTLLLRVKSHQEAPENAAIYLLAHLVLKLAGDGAEGALMDLFSEALPKNGLKGLAQTIIDHFLDRPLGAREAKCLFFLLERCPIKDIASFQRLLKLESPLKREWLPSYIAHLEALKGKKTLSEPLFLQIVKSWLLEGAPKINPLKGLSYLKMVCQDRQTSDGEKKLLLQQMLPQALKAFEKAAPEERSALALELFSTRKTINGKLWSHLKTSKALDLKLIQQALPLLKERSLLKAIEYLSFWIEQNEDVLPDLLQSLLKESERQEHPSLEKRWTALIQTIASKVPFDKQPVQILLGLQKRFESPLLSYLEGWALAFLESKRQRELLKKEKNPVLYLALATLLKGGDKYLSLVKRTLIHISPSRAFSSEIVSLKKSLFERELQTLFAQQTPGLFKKSLSPLLDWNKRFAADLWSDAARRQKPLEQLWQLFTRQEALLQKEDEVKELFDLFEDWVHPLVGEQALYELTLSDLERRKEHVGAFHPKLSPLILLLAMTVIERAQPGAQNRATLVRLTSQLFSYFVLRSDNNSLVHTAMASIFIRINLLCSLAERDWASFARLGLVLGYPLMMEKGQREQFFIACSLAVADLIGQSGALDQKLDYLILRRLMKLLQDYCIFMKEEGSPTPARQLFAAFSPLIDFCKASDQRYIQSTGSCLFTEPMKKSTPVTLLQLISEQSLLLDTGNGEHAAFYQGWLKKIYQSQIDLFNEEKGQMTTQQAELLLIHSLETLKKGKNVLKLQREEIEQLTLKLQEPVASYSMSPEARPEFVAYLEFVRRSLLDESTSYQDDALIRSQLPISLLSTLSEFTLKKGS